MVKLPVLDTFDVLVRCAGELSDSGLFLDEGICSGVRLTYRNRKSVVLQSWS